MTEIKIEVTRQEVTEEEGILLHFNESAWWMPMDAAVRLAHALERTVNEARLKSGVTP